MRLEHIIIGVAVFGFIMLTGMNLFAEHITNYNLDGDSEIFDKLNDTFKSSYSQANSIKTDLENKTMTSTVVDYFVDATTTVKRGFTSLSLIGVVLEQIALKTGLMTSELKDLLMIIVITLAGTFVLYMFWRYKPQ